MSWTAEDVEKAYRTINQKAAVDKAFRARLLANPNQAISEVTGREVPASFKIKVIENLLPKVDALLIGGAMAYTFLKAEGVEVGEVESDPSGHSGLNHSRRRAAYQASIW